MGEESGHNRAAGHSSAGWGSWLGAWLTATTIGTWLFTVIYFVAAGDLLAGRGALVALSLFPLIVLPFLVGVFVLPMTLVAAGLRGLWLHAAPSSWRSAALPAVVGGSLSGTLGQLLLYFMLWATGPIGSEPTGRMLRGWWLDTVSFGLPLILGGATAGYLAHRGWWPTSRRWWMLLTAACVAGVLLLSPTDPTLPFGPEQPGRWRSELPLSDAPPRGSAAGAGSAGALPSLPVQLTAQRRSDPPGTAGAPRLQPHRQQRSTGRVERHVQGVEQEPTARPNASHVVPSPIQDTRRPACACRPEPRPREERSCYAPSWS